MLDSLRLFYNFLALKTTEKLIKCSCVSSFPSALGRESIKQGNENSFQP